MLPISNVYIDVFHKARVVCIANGYAAAIHGSGIKDVDIVAIPFSSDPSKTKTLVREVVKSVGGTVLSNKRMCHGRHSWMIKIDEFHYLDFSVVPIIGDL